EHLAGDPHVVGVLGEVDEEVHAGAAGEPVVGQHEAEHVAGLGHLPHHGLRVLGVVGHLDPHAGRQGLEVPHEGVAHLRLVLDHEHDELAHRPASAGWVTGRTTVNTVRPAVDSTEIVPPWASTIRRLMLSPRPTPKVTWPCLVVNRGSKIRSANPSGMPGPSSVTVTRTAGAPSGVVAGATASSMVTSSPPASTALASRLVHTCWSAPGWPVMAGAGA